MDYSFPVRYFAIPGIGSIPLVAYTVKNLNALTRQAGLQVPRIRFASYAYRFGLDLTRIFQYRPIVVYTVRPL